jgi:hypothetical protein
MRPVNCALRLRKDSDTRAGRLADVLLSLGAEYNIYIAAVIGDQDYVSEALLRDRALFD